MGGGIILLLENYTEVSSNDSECTKEDIFWLRKTRNGKLLRSWDFKSYLLFENTTFEKNVAGFGGAIYFQGGGNATFRNCSFIDNFATNLGGHLYLLPGSASLNMENNVFNRTRCEIQKLDENFTIGSFIHAESLGEFIFHNTTMDAQLPYGRSYVRSSLSCAEWSIDRSWRKQFDKILLSVRNEDGLN